MFCEEFLLNYVLIVHIVTIFCSIIFLFVANYTIFVLCIMKNKSQLYIFKNLKQLDFKSIRR